MPWRRFNHILMNKLNIKLKLKILVLLSLILQGGNVLAESGRLGAFFFGFGKNNVEAGHASTKEIMRQKQAKKAAALNRDTHTEDVEQGKALNTPSPENSASKKSRMTPEERRALRRQIHDAGNEVYVSPK